MALIRGNELTSEQSESLWLVKPFFPREGIVLLYGKKGVGKSPLTWALAEAVATGTPWLGDKPTTTGEVLYLELDTPRMVVEPRIRQAITSSQVAIFFPETPISDPAGWKVMVDQTKHVKPVLVVVNTLRKSHSSTDIESSIPSRLYAKFQTTWPRTCLAFVHHEKKTPTNPDHGAEEGEEFSGSLAWANDAQVVMRLGRPLGRPIQDAPTLMLSMSGNQLAGCSRPRRFSLIDGWQLSGLKF